MSEENNQVNVPEDYKPIGAWGYVGYQILFAIPVVGFIVALVFALGGTQNINLKNYSRSYFIWLLLSILLSIVVVVLVTITGVAIFGTAASSSSLYY